jgi:hypothetical protein
MDILEPSGKQSGLQMWSTKAGVVKAPKLKWHTVVLAKDDDEALELGQAEYACPNTNKDKDNKDNKDNKEQVA